MDACLQLKEHVGALWTFNPANPNGHYVLNLANHSDKQLMLRLMEISSIEVLRSPRPHADHCACPDFEPRPNLRALVLRLSGASRKA